MQSQTEDVIIMAHVETLRILLSVVHNPYSSDMVHYLPSLGIEQVAPAIIPPVAANKKRGRGVRGLYLITMHEETSLAEILLMLGWCGIMQFLSLPMNEVQLYSTPWCSFSLLHSCCSMFLLALLFELR